MEGSKALFIEEIFEKFGQPKQEPFETQGKNGPVKIVSNVLRNKKGVIIYVEPFSTKFSEEKATLPEYCRVLV
ncbi:MAG: hypothetical protein Q8P80_03705 [Candidatus Levybacteria bacterium]|nr:hypothetical protein [Candidatus Levybacteria bacterium]